MPGSSLNLQPRTSPGAQATRLTGNAWRLEIPSGAAGRYRLAQFDDYNARARRDFPWRPPVSLALEARASDENLPGTWGFGWWNDPFSIALGLGGGERRWPALPNAAWFFFASKENYLSFRDDLPANGQTAAIFQAPGWPAWLVSIAAGALPLLAIPGLARQLRRLARRIIHQNAVALAISPTNWQHYQINWHTEGVEFRVEGEVVLSSLLAPLPSLGLVIWIDNQYAALSPAGKFRFGTLTNQAPQWLEIRNLIVSTP
jgi:hypothetical protein